LVDKGFTYKKWMGVYWIDMGIGQCMMQEVMWGLVSPL
jgi:hypothetical protein